MMYRDQICDNRKHRQDLTKFNGLVATPGNLVTGVVLPANAKLYASCDAVIAAPVAVVTIKGKSYSLPACAANTIFPIQYAERDATVQKAAGAPGVISLYIEGNLGKLLKIAQG
jgi:hypothetical protein